MADLENYSQIIYDFWASFSLPAYDESTVPTGDNAPPYPYITYDTVLDGFKNTASVNGSLWYRDTSWLAVTRKADEIFCAIGYGGTIRTKNGVSLWIRRGIPFVQRLTDDKDDMMRRLLINIEVENLT